MFYFRDDIKNLLADGSEFVIRVVALACSFEFVVDQSEPCQFMEVSGEGLLVNDFSKCRL